jgi:copper homeostasis protein CutC
VAACAAAADRLELVADLHTQGLTAPPRSFATWYGPVRFP